MDDKMSYGIEWILSYFQTATMLAGMAQADLDEAEGAMQDILHALELEDLPYHDQAKLARELKQIRQKRRKAKNELETLNLVLEWADANAKTIKSLEQLLGRVRKAEKAQENRTYNQRTGTVKRVLEKRTVGK